MGIVMTITNGPRIDESEAIETKTNMAINPTTPSKRSYHRARLQITHQLMIATLIKNGPNALNIHVIAGPSGIRSGIKRARTINGKSRIGIQTRRGLKEFEVDESDSVMGNSTFFGWE